MTARERLDEIQRRKSRLDGKIREVWAEASRLQAERDALQAEFDKLIIEVEPTVVAKPQAKKSGTPKVDPRVAELLKRLNRIPGAEEKLRDLLGEW